MTEKWVEISRKRLQNNGDLKQLFETAFREILTLFRSNLNRSPSNLAPLSQQLKSICN